MLSKDQQLVFYRKLGENIKAARVNADIKQDSLARHIGLNRVSIVNIEKGKQKVQLHSLFEICVFLNVQMEHLIPPLDSIKATMMDPKLVKTIDKELEQVEDKADGKIRLSEFVLYSKSKS